MTYILIAIAAVLAAGVALILLTAEGPMKTRARKVGAVAGVSLLASSIVAIVAGVLAYALMAGVAASIEDAFAGGDTSSEEAWTDDEWSDDEWSEDDEWSDVKTTGDVDCSVSEELDSHLTDPETFPCLPGQDPHALATLVNKEYDESEVDWSLFCTNGEDDRLCGNEDPSVWRDEDPCRVNCD